MKTPVLAVAACAFALWGCAGSSGGQEAAGEQGYPSLREVPRTTIANTDQGHWNEVEQQMMQVAAELRANPRAQPGPPVDPNAFLQEARGELDATRRAHEAAGAAPQPASPVAEQAPPAASAPATPGQ